jgi:hypothetical protein
MTTLMEHHYRRIWPLKSKVKDKETIGIFLVVEQTWLTGYLSNKNNVCSKKRIHGSLGAFAEMVSHDYGITQQ